MTFLTKKSIIFWAEYGVIIEGFLFLSLVLLQPTLIEQERMVVEGVTVLLFVVILNKILKLVIHKKRGPKNAQLFVPFDRYAFPSGHASGLLSTTYFIFIHNPLIGLVSLLLSYIILYSRVKSHVHDLIDMAGGACVGLLATYYAMPYTIQFASYLLHFFQ